MPIFRYNGRKATGEAVNGEFEAHSINDTVQFLRNQNITPLEITEEKPKFNWSDFLAHHQLPLFRVRLEELMMFCRSSSEADPHAALKKFQRLVADYPEHKLARESLVIMLINEGKLLMADKILAAGLKEKASHLPFIRLKALILAREPTPRIASAIKLLEANLPRNIQEDIVDYYSLLAALYLKNKDFIPSARIYNQLTHLPNPSSTWWLGLATALDGAGKRNMAKEAYQAALNSNDLPPDLRLRIEEKAK